MEKLAEREPSRPARFRRVTCATPWGVERDAEAGELLLRMATARGGQSTWGFGGHPSSSLAISLLLGLYQDGAPNPQRVLDVGCGAGVLSIICARAGAREVRGIDINPAAPAVASWNAADNGAGLCSFDTTPVSEIAGHFELVLANLPSQKIQLELHRELAARAEGGLLISSGYKVHEQPAIEEAYRAARLRLLYTAAHVDQEGIDWCAALFKSAR